MTGSGTDEAVRCHGSFVWAWFHQRRVRDSNPRVTGSPPPPAFKAGAINRSSQPSVSLLLAFLVALLGLRSVQLWVLLLDVAHVAPHADDDRALEARPGVATVRVVACRWSLLFDLFVAVGTVDQHLAEVEGFEPPDPLIGGHPVSNRASSAS